MMNKFVVAFLLMVIVVDMFRPSEACSSGAARRRGPCDVRAKHLGWLNDFDGHLKFTCPAGEAINHVHSVYSGCTTDRAFNFKCSSNSATKKMTTCSWTSYVNNWDRRIDFTCPLNGVMAGIESIHSNQYEDRRWKFYCCYSYDDYDAKYQCATSGYVNSWKSIINYRVPYNRFIVGAISSHVNRHEDRRWEFRYCRAE